MSSPHDYSGRWRIFFELVDVAVLDLPHEGFALEEVAMEIGGQLAGDDEELIVDHFGKRNGEGWSMYPSGLITDIVPLAIACRVSVISCW